MRVNWKFQMPEGPPPKPVLAKCWTGDYIVCTCLCGRPWNRQCAHLEAEALRCDDGAMFNEDGELLVGHKLKTAPFYGRLIKK